MRFYVLREARTSKDMPDQVTVVVEIPRGGFVKRRPAGGIDYISVLPCPFNYGYADGLLGGDGDPQDVVLLGPRRAAGFRQRAPLVGVVRFTDAGAVDDKWIAGERPRRRDRLTVVAFFVVFARAKRLLNLLRRRPGPTACHQISWLD